MFQSGTKSFLKFLILGVKSHLNHFSCSSASSSLVTLLLDLLLLIKIIF